MASASKTRDCPYCKEEIRADAVKCKYCRSSVTPAALPHEGVCPYCKEQIHPEAIKCKHCGSDLRGEVAAECECSQSVSFRSLDILQDPNRPRLCYWVRRCI